MSELWEEAGNIMRPGREAALVMAVLAVLVIGNFVFAATMAHQQIGATVRITNGQNASLLVASSTLAFPDLTIGQNASMTDMVQNTGDAQLRLQCTTTGIPPAAAVIIDGCLGTLYPGASRLLTITIVAGMMTTPGDYGLTIDVAGTPL